MITIEPPSTISNPALRLPLQTRTLICVSLALFALSLQARAQSPTAQSNWQLIWSDEFNAPNGSPPDPAKWNIVTGGKGFGNHELETYTGRPENIQQQNGNL